MGLFDKLTGKDARIQVNFIDNATGESIGATELTPEQLPATFDVATTLTIREQQWSVQEAIPATAAEFMRTGRLTLRLNKVEYVNPENILYSLPTISNELPDVEETARFQEFELSILADDWRQNEFLPVAAAPRIAEEVAAIEDIWHHHSDSADEDGLQTFRQLHVRATIGEPALALDLAQLKAVLGTERLGSLKFRDQSGYVRDGSLLRHPERHHRHAPLPEQGAGRGTAGSTSRQPSLRPGIRGVVPRPGSRAGGLISRARPDAIRRQPQNFSCEVSLTVGQKYIKDNAAN